uniref:IGv domain-containing protein n=1 Tax=Angiostrongylus cantonensis TaxID=6313 RepID=A0A0K0D0F7_ANGCA
LAGSAKISPAFASGSLAKRSTHVLVSKSHTGKSPSNPQRLRLSMVVKTWVGQTSAGLTLALQGTTMTTSISPYFLLPLDFQKGTFLIRYADLDSDQYAGHIWLVDNHQLLQKYTYDGIDASNARVFSRTERVSMRSMTLHVHLNLPLECLLKLDVNTMESICIIRHAAKKILFSTFSDCFPLRTLSLNALGSTYLHQ